MYYIPRGGTRGGADQFTWDSVKTDKDREYYLGHSLKAPVGRWQDGKDLQWFSKDRKDKESTLNDERQKVKQAEKEAMMAALGQKVVKTSPQAAASSQYIQPPSQTSRVETEHASKKHSKRSHKEKRKKKKQRKEKQKKSKKTKGKKKKKRRNVSSSESSSESSSSDSSSESDSSSSADSEEERLTQRRKFHSSSHDDEEQRRVKQRKSHTENGPRRTNSYEKSTSRGNHQSRQSDETISKHKQRDYANRKGTYSDSLDKSTNHSHRHSEDYRSRHRDRSESTSPPRKPKNTHYKHRERSPIGLREDRSSRRR
ncbi:multiple myeloma tumor-associated protein 2 homolog [Asterias rubens]|uniref:multiple myeloma tumor-associated protein 2 homolog n=1 Tax=Asterias rubens TaxID=7604 RepID=UPI00145555F8|nr:multiple myeloma tumor-associated protein 2 homolog [Asterias rubens]